MTFGLYTVCAAHNNDFFNTEMHSFDVTALAIHVCADLIAYLRGCIFTCA